MEQIKEVEINSVIDYIETIYSLQKEVTNHLSEELFKSSSTLEKIYSKAIVPPTFAVDAFKGCKNLSAIYVPTSSVDAYKTADGWSDYANYIVGYDF